MSVRTSLYRTRVEVVSDSGRVKSTEWDIAAELFVRTATDSWRLIVIDVNDLDARDLISAAVSRRPGSGYHVVTARTLVGLRLVEYHSNNSTGGWASIFRSQSDWGRNISQTLVWSQSRRRTTRGIEYWCGDVLNLICLAADWRLTNVSADRTRHSKI